MATSKAWLAALAAGLAFFAPVVGDGISVSDVCGMLAAALTAGAAVWRIPNIPEGS